MVTLVTAYPSRTKYPKGVKPPSINMLKPGTNNAKLGGYITAKKWQGMAMYSLTLQERATCPTSCEQWNNCYGNNMPFAHRFDHTAPDFYTLLEEQLAKLNKKRAGEGFVIRLHVLGDFFSDDYVDFWGEMVLKYPELNAFGYTHHDPQYAVGYMVDRLNILHPDRWQIRFSDDKNVLMSAHVVNKNYLPVKGQEVICPEQQGKTKSCATCGLCWSAPNLKIMFVEH
jgi:hypothetical protein